MAGIMMPMKDVQDWVVENSKILLRVYPLTTNTDCTGKHYRFFSEIIVTSLFLLSLSLFLNMYLCRGSEVMGTRSLKQLILYHVT
jgi:hypothetical protein